MAEAGCLKDGKFQNLEAGNFNAAHFLQKAGAPLSGSTEGTFKNIAPAGAIYMDTTNFTMYVNEGTMASPYWSPVSYDQPGIRAVFTDFRDAGDDVAIGGSAAAVILESGVRVFGDGIVENDSGLTVTGTAEIGNVAQILTTNETAHTLALGMGDTTAIHQPDLHGPISIDIEFTNNAAITNRSLFCGFVGTGIDALLEPMTGGTTTITFNANGSDGDDMAGMFLDTGLTDGDGIFLPHNKGNAAASISTTASGVDLSKTIPAAGTYTRWRVQVSAAGNVTAFIDGVEVGHQATALDADEELFPVFVLGANATTVTKADIKRFAIWGKRV